MCKDQQWAEMMESYGRLGAGRAEKEIPGVRRATSCRNPVHSMDLSVSAEMKG